MSELVRVHSIGTDTTPVDCAHPAESMVAKSIASERPPAQISESDTQNHNVDLTSCPTGWAGLMHTQRAQFGSCFL